MEKILADGRSINLEYVHEVEWKLAKAKSRIAELEEANRWIPVSEGLPEDLRLVEVQGESENSVRKGCDLTWFFGGLCMSWDVKNVKQWRYFQVPIPLPQPPESEG